MSFFLEPFCWPKVTQILSRYFFDRLPRSFNTVLNFYRTGKLHVLEGMCIIDFANELDFWMIKEVMIDTCCNDKFIAKKEHSLKEMQKAKDLEKVEEEEVELE